MHRTDPNIYIPPRKRQRFSNPFVNEPQFHHPHYNQYNVTNQHNVSHPLEANRNRSASIASFKSQLGEIFDLFPPLMEFVSSQRDPHQSLEDLYQVFVSHIPPTPTPTQQIHRYPSYLSSFCDNSDHKQPNTEYPNASDLNCVPLACCADNDITQQTPPVNDSEPVADDDITILGVNPPVTANLTTAKEKMIKHAHRNMAIRCNKIIDSLNATTRNHAKCCRLMRHFMLNEAAKLQILPRVTQPLRVWSGGNTSLPTALDQQQAFKLVRAHWNRQKAALFGDILFCEVLVNLFKIVLQIASLSYKEQVMFYIDLFRGLLSERVQFEQSMSRPVVPNACFDKASVFKKFCENILESFSNGVISMMRIRSVKVCEVNGKKVTKYIKNVNRSQSLAKCYDNRLQLVQNIVTNSTEESLQHAMQSHLYCIQQSRDSELQLIEWKQMQAPIMTIQQTWGNRNRLNHVFMNCLP